MLLQAELLQKNLLHIFFTYYHNCITTNSTRNVSSQNIYDKNVIFKAVSCMENLLWELQENGREKNVLVICGMGEKLWGTAEDEHLHLSSLACKIMLTTYR